MRGTELTVQVSTKLNRSHVVTGAEALILPTLGRTDVDLQETGPQFVSVEDSVCAVHATHGAVAAGLATCCSPRSRSSRGWRGPSSATTARSTGPASSATTTPSASHISPRRARLRGLQPRRSVARAASSCPTARATPGPSPTATGKAMLTVNDARARRVPARPADPADHALPRPVQHHDVQPQRPLPRHPAGPRRRLREPRRPRSTWAWPTATASTSTASGPTSPTGRCATTASWPTRRPAAAPPRTSPRRTCWSRWPAPRWAATRPCRRPSWSAWRSERATTMQGSRCRAARVGPAGNFAGTQCRPLVDRWAHRPATIPSPPLSLLRGISCLRSPTAPHFSTCSDRVDETAPAAPFALPVGSTAVVYCEGQFGEQDGKTANGLVRHSEKYEILSVIDSTCGPAPTPGSSSTGPRTASPCVATLDEAIAHAGRVPDYLICGVAPADGLLSERPAGRAARRHRPRDARHQRPARVPQRRRRVRRRRPCSPG